MVKNRKSLVCRSLCGFTAILIIICLCVIGHSPFEASLFGGEVVSQQKPDEQLEINKTALLDGKDEQIRVGAAFLILSDPSPTARQVLLDTLKSDKNKPARIAVCKALSRCRTEKKEVANSQDFIAPLILIIVASGFRGSAVYKPSTSDNMMSMSALIALATRTESMSLSLKLTL
jgi:hypothetical protein